MASKILKVKLWEDDAGTKWKKNVQEIDGEVLCGTAHHSRTQYALTRVTLF
jgi:D-Tyr-tRNAtyr deacylase